MEITVGYLKKVLEQLNDMMMKVEEGNKLIAEFMQWKQIAGLYKLACENGIEIYYPDELKYHSSWDWLMPVVEKINKIYKEKFPNPEIFMAAIMAKEKFIEDEFFDILGLPICTPINEVWQAVIQFIQWYNQTLKAE